MQNAIKALRKKANLSQRALAEKAQVSQTTIQRAEAGTQQVALNVAMRIALALEAPLVGVFPDLEKKPKKGEEPSVSDEIYTLKLKMKGIQTPFLFRLGSGDNSRIWQCVQATDSAGFMLFRSEDRDIAARIRRIEYAHFLFDAALYVVPDQEEHEKPDIRIYFDDNPEPADFSAIGDEVDEMEEADSDQDYQIGHIKFMLDTIGEEDDHSALNFMDEDGEAVFFNTQNVTLIEFSADLTDLKLRAAIAEGFDEEDAEPTIAPPTPSEAIH